MVPWNLSLPGCGNLRDSTNVEVCELEEFRQIEVYFLIGDGIRVEKIMIQERKRDFELGKGKNYYKN